MADPDPVAIVWGPFVLLEKTEDLPDHEVDAFLEAAEAEIGSAGLLWLGDRGRAPAQAADRARRDPRLRVRLG